MQKVDYRTLLNAIVGMEIPKSKIDAAGTVSEYADGESFERRVFQLLKQKYPKNIFQRCEILNDLYLKNPKVITGEERNNLLKSPTALFLLDRGELLGREDCSSISLRTQNDVSDILFHCDGYYDFISVRAVDMSSLSPSYINISAHQLAQACAYMIENEEYDSIDINYIEIDWLEQDDKLKCTAAHHANLFKADPETLHIDWIAAMQPQFYVRDLDQSWRGTRHDWVREYIKAFEKSATRSIRQFKDEYILPFLKYVD